MILTAVPAYGFSGGINGYSGKLGHTCNDCHSGGVAPTVAFDGPTRVAAGAIAAYRFIVRSRSAQQIAAGFNVAADAGTLAAATANARVSGDELLHRGPLTNVGDEASWSFTWRAPLEPGTYVLYGAGNSVNRNGSTSGDRAAATTLTVEVAVAEPTATPTDTPRADTPTPTEDRPATPTPTASPPLSSATPTPTPRPSEPPSCVGDCNANGEVTVDELVRAVNIALGVLDDDACPAFGLDGDDDLTIDLLVRAVNALLNGCG